MKKLLPLIAILAGSTLMSAAPSADYYDNTGRTDVLDGGVRMIEIQTPKGPFHVWTKRTGNNPRIKVLIVPGGPGVTHEYLEAFDSYFPGAGIEYYYYDPLGCAYSDQPDDDSLWDLPRYVGEIEQVRQALGLDRDNFFLYGQSCGGLFAIEYALKYQQHLKGLIISNMMSNIAAYNAYAKDTLEPQMDPKALKEILALEAAKDYDNPRYEELLMGNYYVEHILRMPPDQWPNGVLRSFGSMNKHVYVLMQGPSEMGSTPDARLGNWDRSGDLHMITVPTLVIGARYDTMDPKHMKWMAEQMPKGRYLYCPNGSHFAILDDQQTYFKGLIQFIKDVDAGKE